MQWSNYWGGGGGGGGGGAGIISNSNKNINPSVIKLSISALDNTAMIAFIRVELLGAWSILSIKLAVHIIGGTMPLHL